MLLATHVGEWAAYNDGVDVTRKLKVPTTVEAMFAFVRGELQGDDLQPVVVEYDQALGYPKRITLGTPNVLDGADFIEITDFALAPRSASLQRAREK
jgi:hypothetical protein